MAGTTQCQNCGDDLLGIDYKKTRCGRCNDLQGMQLLHVHAKLCHNHMCALPGPGLTVRQRMTQEDGTITLQSLDHVMALSAYHVDMIARINLARLPGANARLPCGFCGVEAMAEERHYYPKAYAKPQRHSLLLEPPRDVLANDEALWTSDR